MLPNILKETVRGIQPILIEDEMLQHREVFLIEEVNRKSATDMIKQLMYLDRIDTGIQENQLRCISIVLVEK